MVYYSIFRWCSGSTSQWFVLFSAGNNKKKRRKAIEWKIRMLEKMYSPRVPYSRAHFGFKSIYHIFLFLFSLLHSAFLFFIFSCYFFFLSLSFFLCVYFFVLFNNKCTVVQRFVAISSIICCTRSWLHFIWSVCSIQLNTKHLFNSDENSNINGNHDRSVITTTAIHIYHTIYIHTNTVPKLQCTLADTQSHITTT